MMLLNNPGGSLGVGNAIPGGTPHDILAVDASGNVTQISPQAAGKVLTSNGTSADATFQTFATYTPSFATIKSTMVQSGINNNTWTPLTMAADRADTQGNLDNGAVANAIKVLKAGWVRVGLMLPLGAYHGDNIVLGANTDNSSPPTGIWVAYGYNNIAHDSQNLTVQGPDFFVAINTIIYPMHFQNSGGTVSTAPSSSQPSLMVVEWISAS